MKQGIHPNYVDTHVSCMVAVDDALVDNGCLEVVSARHHELLPTDDTGCIRSEVAAALAWAPVEVRAGETLWFHSRTPHRSGPNLGSTPRRALYPTYNARREGDLRAAYYEQKAAELAGGSAVSLIALLARASVGYADHRASRPPRGNADPVRRARRERPSSRGGPVAA